MDLLSEGGDEARLEGRGRSEGLVVETGCEVVALQMMLALKIEREVLSGG